jgi:hypothetical protein
MKLRILAVGLILSLTVTSFLVAVRSVEAAPLMPGLSVTVVPQELMPAQAGYVYISGGYPLQVTALLDGEMLDVFWVGDGYLALYAFGFDAPPGDYTLSVQIAEPLAGASSVYQFNLHLTAFEYPLEQVALPYSLIPLLDPQLNEQEVERLSTIYAVHTSPAVWDWPFALPVPGGIVTSRFGGSRIYNGGMFSAHHTGVDFRRAIGEPIQATAGGRVVVAEFFEVRGNVVIIDHGHGVFSQYAHLSEFYVQPGQSVQRGQLIGAAGATGRTNGPHLHFEIIVNGIPVDPIRWMALAPGFIPPREVVPARNTPVQEPTGGG